MRRSDRCEKIKKRRTVGILNEKISGYIKDLTNVKDTVLLEMEKYGESIDFSVC